MKKTILLFLLLFTTLFCSAQTEYPMYMEQDGVRYVVITVEQAQKIDNDLELLQLYKKLNVDANSMNMAYIKVIDEYKNQVALLELKVVTQDNLINDQKKMISNLDSQITNYKNDIKKADEQISSQDQIIKNQKKEIKKQKLQKVISWSIISGLIATIVLVVI